MSYSAENILFCVFLKNMVNIDLVTVVVGGHSDGSGVTDKFLTHTESMNNEDRLYVVNLEGFTEETSVW